MAWRNAYKLQDNQKRIERLAQINQMEEDGTFDMLPKKEVIKLKAQRDKLEKYLGGIKDMKKLPGAMFIVDPRKERLLSQKQET